MRKSLVGHKFGRLSVIEETEKRRRGHVVYKCLCDCGNYTEVPGTKLTCNKNGGGNGKTRSCGCLALEISYKDRANTNAVEGTNLDRLTQKKSKNNTSGYKGVSWDKKVNKWKSYIGFNNKLINLGSFKNKQDAINARKEAEEKYFKPILEKYNKE